MNSSLYSTLVLLILASFTGCGAAPSTGADVFAQSNCDSSTVRMGQYCVTPQKKEGAFSLMTPDLSAMRMWYHTPSKRLIGIPDQGTRLSWPAAQALCADFQNRYIVDIPASFSVPSQAEFLAMIRDWPLHELFSESSGRFWTSTPNPDGWLRFVDIGNGDRGEAGHPSGAQAQVFCVAQLS